jgi:UDP-N-acetylmuramoyl-tripeptide--D-alanyl-D-alanine ligase
MDTKMMMLSDAAAMLDSTPPATDAEVLRVVTDSRSIAPGDLFVALRGAKFDGGAYAAQALGAGAVGVVLDATQAPELTQAIRVADTRLALGQLAARWRARFSLPLVAVTGSNGKTTVKDMLTAILTAAASSDAVLATTGNFNNDIGLPLMLLRLNATHRYAVLEMGMNHVGEIDYLTRLARPAIAVVNNAQAAHVGLLGSVEAIAHAKAEIFTGLTDSGIAIINADDKHAPLWRDANRNRRVLGFGCGSDADVRGEIATDLDGSTVTVHANAATFTLRLNIPGEHNAMNALAATTAALALGITPAKITAALAAFGGVKGRLQTTPALYGSTFIDDSYNANPDSVAAAIKVLAARNGQKILVLGDMGELGHDVGALHAQVGLAARQAGINRLLALGEQSRETVRAFGAGAMHFERIEELLAELENALDADTTVLVKGSRFMQMERVVMSFRETH